MKLTITTPLSTATPLSAMKPTPAEIESEMSRNQSARFRQSARAARR